MSNDRSQSDVSDFFSRLKGQDRIRKSDSLIVLNTPQTDRERKVKQKISSIVQYVKNKTWSRRHVEFFEEYRRMVATFPIIKSGIDIYGEEMCYLGDTQVVTLDNETISLEELEKQGRKNFWLYGIDPETKRVIPVQCDGVVCNGIREYLELRLDDGTVLKCTPDHLMLLTSGNWVEAKDLKFGDSLQSLYTRLDRKGYLEVSNGELTKTNKKLSWNKVHSIVGNSILKEQRESLPQGKYERTLDNMPVVHHKTFNKLKNAPENLEWMLWKEHKDFHNSLNSERWKNKEFSEKMSKIFSETVKKNWADPEWAKDHSEKYSITMKTRFANMSQEEVKVAQGRPGEQNGMYGTSRIGDTNPNYNPSFRRDVTIEEVKGLIYQGYLLSEIRVKLNLSHSDLETFTKQIRVQENVRDADNIFYFNLLKEFKILKFKNPNLGVLEFVKTQKVFYKRNFSFSSLNIYAKKIGYLSFGDYAKRVGTNHKIVSVTLNKEKGKVYDIVNAGEFHNFAVKCNTGMIITHNCAQNSDGKIFTIKCDNKHVKDLLEECFFKNLALNAKGFKVARMLCQFGNAYAYLITRPKDGVTDMCFLPPEAMIREQMYDPSNLENYRFTWYGAGGGALFEPWEIVHWKNGEDIEMEPYGSSILRPIVDTWRRVVLIREALVIYRITRAPSKLLFKVGTDGLTGEEAFRFAQDMKKEVSKKPLVNPQTGEIDFRYNPMPIASYTPIPLLDGRTITIEELAKEYEEGKENYVYSIQDNTHQVVAGKVKWCGKNYTANKLIRVWLDNESYIDSAEEHPFVLRDGTKKRADELLPEDSLMPFYQKKERIQKRSKLEYQQIYNPASGKHEFTHRLVAKEVDKEKEGLTTIHHVNFDRFNNTPENLLWMDYYAHRNLHGDLLKERWTGPDNKFYRQQASDVITAYNKTPEARAKVTRNNIERESYKAMMPYKRSEKGRAEQSVLAYEMLEKRLDPSSNWKANMSVKFDEYIWQEINKAIVKKEIKGCVTATNYINKHLINHLKSINVRQDLLRENKISRNIVLKEIRKNGFQTWEEYKQAALLNHKVSRVEVLENVNTDVYCMTVVGLNNEDDRHNFAYCGINTDKSWNVTGSFTSNSVEENIFMPVYEGSPSDVSVLEGAGNLDAVEDYKIIKDDLFAGLKIPKSWLSFEEDLSNKSALGEEDIRFAKTIQRLQSEFVEGLLHIGVVHLFLKGCSQEEMQSFTLEMNNPSIASEKKKLELIQARLDIAKSAWDYNNPGLNLMSYVDVLKSILKFTDSEIETTIKAQFNEKKIAWRLEQLRVNGSYDEPDMEKKLAALKGMTGNSDGKTPTGFEDLTFEGGSLTEIMKRKIDEEIREIIQPVSASASTKMIRQLTENIETGSELLKNLKKSRKDFGMK